VRVGYRAGCCSGLYPPVCFFCCVGIDDAGQFSFDLAIAASRTSVSFPCGGGQQSVQDIDAANRMSICSRKPAVCPSSSPKTLFPATGKRLPRCSCSQPGLNLEVVRLAKHRLDNLLRVPSLGGFFPARASRWSRLNLLFRFEGEALPQFFFKTLGRR